jgi:adenosine deaminase
VTVTINSDDPGMMQFDIGDEYVAVAEAFAYDVETMEDLSLTAVDASWASEGEKAALRSRFLTDFDGLRAEAGLPARE